MQRILLVCNQDDLIKLIELYTQRLHNEIEVITIVRDIKTANDILAHNSFNKITKIILDVHLPDEDPTVFAEEIEHYFPQLKIIGLTTSPKFLQEHSKAFKEVYLSPYTKDIYLKILS
jgi:CheY-like chemotaxis protein